MKLFDEEMVMIKNLLKKTELYVGAIILLIAIIIELRSKSFFMVNNIVNILNASVVPGLFTISTFMIILSGGMDISFPAVAALTSYVTVDVLNSMNYDGPVVLIFIIAAILGALCGAVNAFFIAKMKLPPLIVTLGTQSVFRGILQGALNASQINMLPQSMNDFGKSSVYVAINPKTGTSSHLPTGFLIMVTILIISYIILNKTLFGRGIYAIGGDAVSAERAGFNVVRIRFFLYIFSGIVAGLTGIIRSSMNQMVHPTNLFGIEMTIIAGVILGGVSLIGGRGSLTGAMLGMYLITMVENSLLLLGIPAYWQTFFVGAVIIIGISATSYRSIVASRKPRTLRGDVLEVEHE